MKPNTQNIESLKRLVLEFFVFAGYSRSGFGMKVTGDGHAVGRLMDGRMSLRNAQKFEDFIASHPRFEEFMAAA